MPATGLARTRAIALTLADVEEGTTFGYPAFKVNGKTFAWFPKKKEVEPGTLGVRMSILERPPGESQVAKAGIGVTVYDNAH